MCMIFPSWPDVRRINTEKSAVKFVHEVRMKCKWNSQILICEKYSMESRKTIIANKMQFEPQ